MEMEIGKKETFMKNEQNKIKTDHWIFGFDQPNDFYSLF